MFTRHFGVPVEFVLFTNLFNLTFGQPTLPHTSFLLSAFQRLAMARRLCRPVQPHHTLGALSYISASARMQCVFGYDLGSINLSKCTHLRSSMPYIPEPIKKLRIRCVDVFHPFRHQPFFCF